jgi:hypothetical protein
MSGRTGSTCDAERLSDVERDAGQVFGPSTVSNRPSGNSDARITRSNSAMEPSALNLTPERRGSSRTLG